MKNTGAVQAAVGPWEANVERRDFLTLAGGLPLLGFAGTPAKGATDRLTLCVSSSGVFQIATADHPIPSWDGCEFEVEIVGRAFNTTELTWVLSVGYDAVQKEFARAAAGNTQEYLLPGEDLLVLDYKIRHRHLVYSLAANRFFLANLSKSETKLVGQSTFSALRANYDGPILLMTSNAPRLDKNFTPSKPVEEGALLLELDSVFLSDGRERVEVLECVGDQCFGVPFWVAREDVAELTQMPIVAGPLPKIIEFPKDSEVKACTAKHTTSHAQEYQRGIAAELDLTDLLGLKLGTDLDQIEKTFQSREYDKTTKIDWSTFTIVYFEQPRSNPRNQKHRQRWRTKSTTEIVLQVTTAFCEPETEDAYERKILSAQGAHRIGNWTRVRRIRNSAEHRAFVDRALAKTQGRIEPWIIRHIAAALSAFAPAQ